MNGDVLDLPNEISVFSEPTSIRARLIATPILVSAFLVFPGTTNVSPPTAGAIFVNADLPTGIGGFSAGVGEPAERTVAPATAGAIQHLRARSGLTWDEIARAFGVSRRTAHAWASGSKLNQEHSARLSVLARAVDRLDAGSPELTRAAFHAPGSIGLSPYQSLIRSLAQPGNRREGFAPWELLGTDNDQESSSDADAVS